MISERPAVEREPHESDERDDDRGDCDPHLIDVLTCKAQGVAAQAAYNLTYEADLHNAQSAYDTTRKDYRTKRHLAALQVQEMRHQIKRLIGQIKCLIKQERVVDCLDEAWARIQEQLEDCGGARGCCADEDCDFDVDVDDLDYRSLDHRIGKYQHRANDAKDCFNNLVKEPSALDDRVIKYKGEIDDVNVALSADPATTDLKTVYAKALVARRHIELVWNGFDETNDFVECLCRALTCWTKGCAAVSVLTGEKAVRDCKRDAHVKHCETLKTSTVDEILGLYDKICAPHILCEDDDEDEDEEESASRYRDEDRPDRDRSDRERPDRDRPDRRSDYDRR
ncbi:MAG: hypothetical protein ACREQ5_01330 [Candidatus Dormibacteria bacterium]